MVLQWDLEIATERLHAFVTLADPFSTDFANKFRVLLKPKRGDATTGALPRFQNRNIPTRLLVFERMRCR